MILKPKRKDWEIQLDIHIKVVHANIITISHRKSKDGMLRDKSLISLIYKGLLYSELCIMVDCTFCQYEVYSIQTKDWQLFFKGLDSKCYRLCKPHSISFLHYYSFFMQPLKNVKAILSLWAIQKQVMDHICSMGHSLQTPLQTSFLLWSPFCLCIMLILPFYFLFVLICLICLCFYFCFICSFLIVHS